VFARVLERHAGAHDQVPHRLGDDELGRPRNRGDPGPDGDAAPRHVVPLQLDLAGVDAAADLDAEVPRRGDDRLGARVRPRRSVEGREVAVAHRLDHAAPRRRDLVSDEPVVHLASASLATAARPGHHAPVDVPETRYAKARDGTSIAFQVVGDGPVDLVYAAGIWANVDLMWDLPAWAHFLDRLTGCARLIAFDMRGVGVSDRGPEPPSIELQRDDIASVMDAVGMEDAIVFGCARAAAMAMLFAATHPERTRALILYAPVAKTVATADFPHGKSPEEQEAFVRRFVREVGTGRNLALQAPSVAADERFVAWWARFERSVASPSAYEELARIFTDVDVGDVLPAIHVPTLVIRRKGDLIVPAAQARYVAERIEGARLVELPGDDHIPFIGDGDAVADEIEEFVTGARPSPSVDRILATVLFTDIVGSTERQAALGDRAWKSLVEQHHAVVRRALNRFGGLEQDTAGDGFYLRFDGPGRAIRCAQEIVAAVRPLGIEVRAGLHTGECELVEGKCSGLSCRSAPG
jgi:pimeloyl-ACP methyl ester carboxylesterase